MKASRLQFNRIPILLLLVILQVVWFVFLVLRLAGHFWWITLMLQLLSIVAVLIIVNKRNNPAFKLALVIPILAFPILGGFLYLLFGGRKPARRMRRKFDRSWKNASDTLVQDPETLQSLSCRDTMVFSQMRYMLNVFRFPVYRNTTVKYYESGEMNLPDILKALENARRYIFIEYFIIAEGVMWKRILDVLKEKALSGLDVRLIYDDLGSLDLISGNYRYELEKYNIKIAVFNPVVPFFTTTINHRDHRKIMIIDGHTGFTGGMNIADEYINDRKRFGYWKDSGIRLTGDAVYSLTVMFLTTWNALRGSNDNPADFKPARKVTGKTEQNIFIQPYSDSPLDSVYLSRNVYLNMINMAIDYVYVFTPYLIIDNELMTALCLAAERGVDLRIITPGIPDKKIVYYTAQSYYVQLIEAGVKIYRFSPGFLHAKCMVCDDKTALVGTVNMDYRSLYLNFECGVCIYGASVVKEIKADFEKTVEKSALIDKETLQRNYALRFVQSVLRLFAPIM
jgi:cardiolipin synthase A/B